MLEGRHFTATKRKKHSLADLIDRSIGEVLPLINGLPLCLIKNDNYTGGKPNLDTPPLPMSPPAIIVRYRNTLTHGRANGTVNRYLAVLESRFHSGWQGMAMVA